MQIEKAKLLSSIHLVFHAGQGVLPRVRQQQININFVSNLNLSVTVEQSAECSLYGLADALLDILNFLFFLYQFPQMCWGSSPLNSLLNAPSFFLF